MRALALDPRMGASGDMLLGTCIDAGADRSTLDPVADALEVTFEVSSVVDQGVSATSVRVDHPDGDHAHGEHAGPHRRLDEVREIVDAMAIPDDVRRSAGEAFELLARAEASVHGTSVEETHFHEVGADDAIADVTGTLLLLDDLDVEEVLVGPIATGSGEVATSHGTYPIPPPAVTAIAERSDLRLRGGPVEAELLTPTGATLLATIGTAVETFPAISVTATGYGAGQQSFGDRPNVLRSLVGTVDGGFAREPIAVLETNVDDASPELLGNLHDRLRAAGARDVSIVPLTMKKSRPGHLVRVVTEPADEQRVAKLLAEETGTLGVRVTGARHRWIADRETVSVTLAIEGVEVELAVKIGRDESGTVYDVSAEFDDAAAIAERVDRPVRDVMRRAEAAARSSLH